MDTLVATAIVGTGQQNNPTIQTATAIDTLTTQLPASDAERKLLLTAGALAIYRQAGQVAQQAASVPTPAEPEKLSACSEKVRQMLANLLGGTHSDLLPEALARLEQAHQRLPHDLLPQALTRATHTKEDRPIILPVLGERGIWLSQRNSAWSWVTQLQSEAEHILPADFETVWQEGSVEQRKEILLYLRSAEPAKACDWLQDVWKKEKAETRTTLLSTFTTGLSLEDQPFLERALEDRAENVRSTAARLLTQLPTSPQTQRLLARADTLLNYEHGKLTVILPVAVDKAWVQDVTMLKQTKAPTLAASHWMVQALSRVPLTHWEERFQATPGELTNALKDEEWRSSVVAAWSAAALLHATTNWFSALLDLQYSDLIANNTFNHELYAQFLSHLPQDEAENRALALLRESEKQARAEHESENFHLVLAALPKPWSQTFSAAYLEAIKQYDQILVKKTRGGQYNYEWHQTLQIAGLALAADCFDSIPTDWETAKENNWYVTNWRQQVEDFTQKIQIRKSLLKEIQ